MPIFREMILHVLSIWYFHESLLSTVMPKNLMNEITSKGVSSKMIFLGSVSIFGRLRDSLFAFIHWVTFSSSEFTTLTREFGFLWE